jgi:DNA repair exonuclease SbcCD ATPase subunit
MIRRLCIRGWRAFDDLTLDLTDGLTFVVAENGVGKTSLLQAAAWGLYGTVSHVDARAARRIGAPVTRVEVDLELPDGRTLAIVREVQERSEPMHAHIGDKDLDDNGVARVLAEAFGASREFLSMTTMLPGDAVADDAAGAFHLQAHLRRVFGVDDLQDGAEVLRRLHEEADAAAKKVRQATRRAAADRTRLRALFAEAEAAETSAQSARTDARRILEFAESQLREAREHEALRAQAAVAKQEFAELLARSRRILGRGTRLGRVSRPAELATHLDAAEVAAADAVDEHRREAATVAGRLAAVRAAASALHSAEAECPVCRRELSADDIARAEGTHQQEINKLLAVERRLAARVESAQRHPGAEPASGEAPRDHTDHRWLRRRRRRGRVRGAGRPRGRGTARRASGGGPCPTCDARRTGCRRGPHCPRNPGGLTGAPARSGDERRRRGHACHR